MFYSPPASQGTPVPSGITRMWGGAYNALPTGWVICDGSAISRSTYAALFAAIGTNFGVGDGSTTFNVPNFLGTFPRGAPASTNPGGTGGTDNQSLTTAGQLPAHNHTITDPGHTHVWPHIGGSGGLSGPCVQGITATVTLGNATTGITINNTGSSNTFDNRPAFLHMVMMIKT